MDHKANTSGVAHDCALLFCRVGAAVHQVQVMGTMLNKLKEMGRAAKRDGLALYFAARDPRVPWTVKVLAVLVAAYVLSPIDLIPDFIPVIGYLDELVLVPVAVALIVRSLDPAIMEEHRAAAALVVDKPQSLLGAMVIVTLWITVALISIWYLWPMLAA